MERDEHGDLISDRGFRHTSWIEGVPGYGGRVVVYESSGAAAPRVWIGVEEGVGTALPGEEPTRANVHLEVEDARQFAQNILRVCDQHYQLRGNVSDE
jgi:hypothetical protein